MKKDISRIWTEEFQKKILVLSVTVAFILLLIPLFWIAHYNFMSVDDYAYGLHSGNVWKETHSVWKVLIAQIGYTWDYYFQWQGTFFSEWLTTSVTGIFAENAYYMGTYFSLGGFIIAECWMLMTIFRLVLHADRAWSWVVSLIVIAMQFLMLPSPCEAFYWMCSAMLYTFCLAMAFCLIALWILVYYDGGSRKWKRNVLTISTTLVTIAVGGGNYIIGLVMVLLQVFCVAWYYYKKHPRRVWMTIMGILHLSAFLLNVLAPGNKKRQEFSSPSDLSAIESIMKSLWQSFHYLCDNMVFLTIVLMVLLGTVFVKMVKKCNYKFRFPLLVTLISFGIYAAQFVPTMYSMGMVGPARAQNLYSMTYWLWLFGNELYWIGWVSRQLEMRGRMKQTDRGQAKKSWIFATWLLGAVFMAVGVLQWDRTVVSSYNALCSLRSGEAQTYYQEYQDRLTVLHNPDIKEVFVKPFSVQPFVLYFGDISYDTNAVDNVDMATYFGKDIVGYLQ